jgi:hypothetical protein
MGVELTAPPHKNPVVRKLKVGSLWPIYHCHAKDDDYYFFTVTVR